MAVVFTDLNVQWNHGTARRSATPEPPIHVHRCDERTYILRQSKTVNYEAPFLFLLVGAERALLLDTGATADPALFPLRSTVDGLLPPDFPLVVAHSHGHGDHVAADSQFADRPETTVVGVDLAAVQSFFGFSVWPDETVAFELGGRRLEIIGSPGHHAAAITVYDPHSGFLLTGDTILPGRLYAADYKEFLATLDRLVAFTEAHTVGLVLGCHVEMRTRPGRDFPIGATYQPGERALEFTVDQLRAVRDAAYAVRAKRGIHRFDDFFIYNEPRTIDKYRLLGRGLLHQATSVLR
jgi:glyoxylase-like metal-dependent hydrolase (beta-lactamase superfamily II)